MGRAGAERPGVLAEVNVEAEVLMVLAGSARIIAKMSTPVPRRSAIHFREKDMPPQKELRGAAAPIVAQPIDYPAGWYIEPHMHREHQLLYAVRGVMLVEADAGRWVVPPTRGIWMIAGMTHAIRCVGEVHMRSLLIAGRVAPESLDRTQTVAVSPLLRELIRAAMDVRTPWAADSRDGRLMRLILDELQGLPTLPLHLHLPTDPRILEICNAIQARLDDTSTLLDWAKRLSVDVKTVQRVFTRETGMTFGQWRQQARLLRALELLACGEKVIDVALSLGYESPAAFATMFRRHFGESPSRFFAEMPRF